MGIGERRDEDEERVRRGEAPGGVTEEGDREVVRDGRAWRTTHALYG